MMVTCECLELCSSEVPEAITTVHSCGDNDTHYHHDYMIQLGQNWNEIIVRLVVTKTVAD